MFTSFLALAPEDGQQNKPIIQCLSKEPPSGINLVGFGVERKQQA